MKVSADYKRIIDGVSSAKWHLLATRAGVPPLPVCHKFFPLSSLPGRKLYGTSVPVLVSWVKEVGAFYVQTGAYKKTIENITSLLFDFRRVSLHARKVLSLCDRTMASADFFYRKDLSKLSNKELLKKYNRVTALYGLTFLQGYITWCAQVLQYEGLKIMSDHTRELKELGTDSKSAFGILVTSRRKSLYAQKEESLMNLSARFKSNLLGITPHTVDNIKTICPKLHRAIITFLRKYKWVGYDYTGPVMSYEEVVASILDKENHTQKALTSKVIIAACGLTKRESRIYGVFSLLSFLKDTRNICDDFVHFCLDFFYAEIGRRMNLSLGDIRYLWPKELEGLVLGRSIFKNAAYFSEKRACSYQYTHNGFVEYAIGQHAVDGLADLLGVGDLPLGADEIHGTTASIGKVVGIVKLVSVYSDVDKVRVGDILVSTMTSPRFMAGISRAGALITDEGGLTCHAAIVAREMRKPCIIGTKIATKVLKDGDLVEVDADKGVVRILKRA